MRSPAAPSFEVGDKIQVEVTSFGPLGASVAVVGIGHGAEVELLPVDAEPYGIGLISQQEISFFRQARDNVDVVRGEVLPAYVLKVRYVETKAVVVELCQTKDTPSPCLSYCVVRKMES